MASNSLGFDSSLPSTADWIGSLRKHVYVLPPFLLKVYIALKTEMEKVNKLQNIKEELERNVSLQLVSNLNISQKIMNLSSTMQEIATKLCYELYRRQAEHKCNPCPKKWLWHENNCYLLSDDSVTWQESKELCSAEKASLLMIKNKSILEFLKRKRLRGYWLGLSPRNDSPSYQALDEIFVPSKRDMRNTDYISNGIYCGYLDNVYLYFTTCAGQKKFICEKSANPVKIESTLMIKVPEESV
ncbi:C-type lectin domain family 12 member A isoform X2 [Dasypus novemcinctus]|uniref:C-type lectin domain family 12 member A isoform X2 n=1 Tax=Dasypus novemcinctus TaxID=9361 RepID=UPI00265E268D|nr:C-type lectin domain family 12 member A isoform X2 [Dasypus novemcinctus]